MLNKVKLDCKQIIIIAISSICGGFVFIVLYLQQLLIYVNVYKSRKVYKHYNNSLIWFALIYDTDAFQLYISRIY